MDQDDAAGYVRIFDAMTCLRIVFHHLTCAAATRFVYLEENGSTGASNADAVILNEGLDYHRIDDGFEEVNEVGIMVEVDVVGHNVLWDGAERLVFYLRHKDWMAVSPVRL